MKLEIDTKERKMAVGGLNTDKIHALCTDIHNYQEKIQDTLKQIYEILEHTKYYYNGLHQDLLMHKVEKLRLSTHVIINNISSYADDYEKVMTYYENNDQQLSLSINGDLLNDIKEER